MGRYDHSVAASWRSSPNSGSPARWRATVQAGPVVAPRRPGRASQLRQDDDAELKILGRKHMVDSRIMRVLGRSTFHDTVLTSSSDLCYLGGHVKKNIVARNQRKG